MAEEKLKPFADYDRVNDTLFLRFDEAAQAQTIQFSDWLMLRVGTDSGRILAVEIGDFENLKHKMARYVERHRRKVKKAAQHLGKCDASYDRESDSLWIHLRPLEGDPGESAVMEKLTEGLIAYRGKGTGRILAFRFPRYSHRWYALLKHLVEIFTEEIMKESPRKGSDKQRRAVGEFVSQLDPAQLQDLAGIGA